MSETATRVCRTWPRVYLDSAEIIGIAEGRTEAGTVESLVSAMRDHFAILVVSVEHLQESLPTGDGGAPDRVADALERFGLRAVVTRSPFDIEPWKVDPSDIEIELAANIREVLTSPAAEPKLAELSAGQDVVFEALERGLVAARRHSPVRVPKRARELQLQAQ